MNIWGRIPRLLDDAHVEVVRVGFGYTSETWCFPPPHADDRPLFIEIEIEKNRFLIKKKIDPKLPRNLLVYPAPGQRRAAAVRIDAPPNDRQFRN